MSDERKRSRRRAAEAACSTGSTAPPTCTSSTTSSCSRSRRRCATYIIDTIGEIGGHFGANLGTCELAVALHSLLDSPRDKILWDVGHQAYPHKILTGRRERLPTIRQYEGLAPFCSIFESEHDIMGAGHASTSIGYAVGLKEAMRKGIGEDGKVAAVIGDGALTGGVAYEALHAAGGLQTPIVIVLNDNGMSISPNVGALSRYFNRVRLNPRLYHAREGVEDRLTKLPLGLGRRIERLGPEIKSAIKAYWAPGLFFEELDLAYMGVIDGHDVARPARGAARGLRGRTPGRRPHPHRQGQGLRPGRGGRPRGDGEMARGQAELDRRRRSPRAEAGRRCRSPTRRRRCAGAAREAARRRLAAAVHAGLRRRDRRRGRARPAGDRDHRGDGGGDRAAEARRRGCPSSTTTSASPSRTRSCSPPASRSRAPSRSARSTRPSSSAPTTRSSTTSACRSSTSPSRWTAPGLVGDDGPTHHGAFDVSYFRPIPNVVVMAPRDEAMLVHMLRTAIAHDGPGGAALPARRGRGGRAAGRAGGDPDRHAASCCASGERVALLGYGYGVSVALRGGRDPRRPRPRADRRRRPLRQAARRRAARAARARATTWW